MYKVIKIYNGDYDDEEILGTYSIRSEAHDRAMEEWDNEPDINHEHMDVYVEREEINEKI